MVIFAASATLGATWQVEAWKDTGGHAGLWGNVGRNAYHVGATLDEGLRRPVGWAAYELPGGLIGGTVISATIEYDVYGCADGNDIGMGFTIEAMTCDWVEGTNSEDGACYMGPEGSGEEDPNLWPGGHGWGTNDVIEGVIADTGVIPTRTNDDVNYDTYNVDVASIVEQWAGGTANFGVLMVPYCAPGTEGINYVMIGMDTEAQGASSDYSVEHGTILHIEYTPNDTPGVWIQEFDGINISEEGATSDKYTVQLTTEPSDTVTITVDPDMQTEVNGQGPGNPVDLIFSTENWGSPQTVVVKANDDSIIEDDYNPHIGTISHSVASDDSNYGMAVPDVVASIIDNDLLCIVYLDSDINEDCYVNVGDLYEFSLSWLKPYYGFTGDVADKNPVIFAPEIAQISIDGNLSEWQEASDWADFGAWYNTGASEGQPVTGLASTTRVQYAWNDAADKLFIGIESTEGDTLILEVGGLMGKFSNPYASPNLGVEAAQIEFKNWAGGIPNSVINQPGGVTTGVFAAYTISGGTITIEIETKIWESWQMGENPGWGYTNVDLVNRGDVYMYANVANAAWDAGDSQIADGINIYLYANPVIGNASIVRLLQNPVPVPPDDLPSIMIPAIPDYNSDYIVNFEDFASFGAEWMQDTALE